MNCTGSYIDKSGLEVSLARMLIYYEEKKSEGYIELEFAIKQLEEKRQKTTKEDELHGLKLLKLNCELYERIPMHFVQK